jgi:hypothetical protein
LFFQATCASEKTPLGLQTWILSAVGGQNMRCGRPQPLVEKGYAFFDSLSRTALQSGFFIDAPHRM